MNILQSLENKIKEGLNRDIQLHQRRPDLFQVFIPYFYPDGDMIEVFLKMEKDGKVLIQDMGMTIMRMSYEFDLETKNKRKLFNEILGNYGVEESGNNLSLKTSIDEIFPYLMEFIQVITKVTDISYLKRETVRSLFYEYFEKFIFENFDKEQLVKDFYPEFDREKQYPTPYALLRKKTDLPVCFYPIASDEKCNETTITIQHYEIHDFRPDTIAVFENQEDIGRKPLARLSNTVNKQFSTLQGNEFRIKDFISRLSLN